MKIYIDADGCPVVDITIKLAKEFKLECIIMCDTSHIFEREYAKTITLSKGADSVDFAIVNMISAGDIIITQDYGLSAMCLAKRGIVLSQNGMEYTSENIDALLMERHTAKKIRMSGGRLHGNAKRTKAQDISFEEKLREILNASCL